MEKKSVFDKPKFGQGSTITEEHIPKTALLIGKFEAHTFQGNTFAQHGKLWTFKGQIANKFLYTC